MFALIIGAFSSFNLLAEDNSAPIFIHEYHKPDSSGCYGHGRDSSTLAGVVACNGDTLRSGVDFELSEGRLCLISNVNCDSILIITQSKQGLQTAPYSIRPYVTTTQIATVGEPVDTPAGSAGRAGSNLKIAGSKSFSADVSDRGRTTLAQGLIMTVTGDLGHDISVRGSFSDRGLRDNRLVTRRFSELENIYLEVESPKMRSVFGNFQFRQDKFQIIPYQRNVQGLQLAHFTPRQRTETTVSAPQGNFGQFEFTTADGFYGPYRLQGRSGEQGIAVVENSDAVWMNGEKLQRGRDQDYYIDYLRGELFFTGRRVIDADDRVRAEYEFQRLEYRKTLVSATNTQQSRDSSRVFTFGYTGFLSSKNDPLDFSLSESEIATLEQAGDNRDAALVSGAKFVGAGSGNYVLDTDSSGAEIFNFVGEGLGDYQVSFSEFASGDYVYLGNGWYQYVGVGNGRFLPLKQLPLPENINLTAAAGAIKISNTLRLSGETVLSSYDRNRFSSKDDGDNSSVAGLVGLKYGTNASRVSGDFSAEVVPDGFPRITRTENVEESYLWQRSDTTGIGRKRAQAGLSIAPGGIFSGRISSGYSDEQNGFVARRFNLDSEVAKIAKSKAKLQVNMASSEQGDTKRSLLDLKPQVESEILPVKMVLRGEYDRRKTEFAGANRVDNKREIESTASYGGVSIGGRLRENWLEEESSWSQLDSKRSLVVTALRAFGSGNKIDAAANVNRYKQGGVKQDYQTGSLALNLPALIPATELAANYRLNRRGFSQTNQTYLKVDAGEGDYVLIDSVYAAQSRGDYILVTEQVGDVAQSVEAEKRFQADISFAKLAANFLTRGSVFRYEVNFREIGIPDRNFTESWLLPPLKYFEEGTRFATRFYDYRFQQYQQGIRLRAELSYTLRRDENNLEVTAPIRRNSDELRLAVSKNFADRDNAQLALVNRERSIREYGRVNLNLREKRIEVTASHFSGPWEWTMNSTIAREHADSLDLLAYSVRVAPGLNYNLSQNGRIEFAPFVLNVSEHSDRTVFLQMAEGFPTGTHWGGRVKIDIGLSESFSFKVFGQAEIRENEENRYFLRSELVSKFQ
ncbi:MAG: hypothetical protein WBP29_01350 [Candidatus Zixiibacteriota bacterium]